MHIERFQRSITLLRQVAEEQKPFIMEVWFKDESNPLDCRTAACAGGWMVRDPWMQEQGLKVDTEGLTPRFGRYSSYDAMAAFLHISLNEADYLFASWCYDPMSEITPDVVADRMQTMLDNH